MKKRPIIFESIDDLLNFESMNEVDAEDEQLVLSTNVILKKLKPSSAEDSELLKYLFNQPQNTFDQAIKYYHEGELDKALNILDSLIAKEPMPSEEELIYYGAYERYLRKLDIEWFKLRAKIYGQQNKLDKEIDDLEKIISINNTLHYDFPPAFSENKECMTRVCEIYFSREQYDLVRDYLQWRKENDKDLNALYIEACDKVKEVFKQSSQPNILLNSQQNSSSTKNEVDELIKDMKLTLIN